MPKDAVQHDSGKTVSAFYYNITPGGVNEQLIWNQTLNTNTGGFESWLDANYAQYRNDATEEGTSGRYVLSTPSGVEAAGPYEVVFREISANNTTDPVVGIGDNSAQLTKSNNDVISRLQFDVADNLYVNVLKVLGQTPSGNGPIGMKRGVSILISADINTMFSREIQISRDTLSLISSGSSTVTVSGGINANGPLATLYQGTVTSVSAQQIGITGMTFLQIQVTAGDPVYGNIT